MLWLLMMRLMFMYCFMFIVIWVLYFLFNYAYGNFGLFLNCYFCHKIVEGSWLNKLDLTTGTRNNPKVAFFSVAFYGPFYGPFSGLPLSSIAISPNDGLSQCIKRMQKRIVYTWLNQNAALNNVSTVLTFLNIKPP